GIAQRGPVRVVAVLFAAPGVAAGGLQVPVRPRAYPDIRIGGRNGQRVDAPDHVPVDDAPSARVEVVEFTRAAAPPAVARPAVVYIDQAGVAGRRVWRLLRVRLLRSCGHGGFYGRFPERYDRGDSGGRRFRAGRADRPARCAAAGGRAHGADLGPPRTGARHAP